MTRASGGIAKAVILARGLGTRMRQLDSAAALTGAQARVAETGVKGMMPVGRPFMDYILSALADAGYWQVCLVIGPDHSQVRDYYSGLSLTRLDITFAIQPQPRGTADAVAAGESFAGGEDFLVLNSDNYYPVSALAALRGIDMPGLAAFATAHLAESGIPRERLATFPRVEADVSGNLRRLGVPGDDGDGYVSMNCWRFDGRIFEACRGISPSARGEMELPDAVTFAVERLGVRFRVLPFDLGVLDISSRADVPGAASRLRHVPVRL